MSARIRLTVDRLVLRGIRRDTRDAVVRALQGELERVLAGPSFREGLQSHHVPSIRGGEFRTRANGGSAELGRRAAQNLVRAIRRSS